MLKSRLFKIVLGIVIIIFLFILSRIEIIQKGNTGVKYISNIPQSQLLQPDWYFNLLSEEIKSYSIESNLEISFKMTNVGNSITIINVTRLIDNKLVRYELKYTMLESIAKEIEVKYGRGADILLMMKNAESAIRASFIENNGNRNIELDAYTKLTGSYKQRGTTLFGFDILNIINID